MSTDHAASVQGVALRVCKLDATGAPITAAGSYFTTNAFLKLSFTPEYTSGDEVETKAADGSVCVYYQTLDVLKRVNLAIDICSPDPELSQILAGGTLLSSGSDVVGYQSAAAGSVATPNGVAIEVWSKAILNGRIAPTNPYWRWVFPYTQMHAAGERTLENGMLANTFEGWGLGNDEFGAGPLGDWAYACGSPYQYARVASFPASAGLNA